MVMAGLLLIGTVWGTSNAFIKRGALIAQGRERDRKAKEAESSSATRSTSTPSWLLRFVKEWFHLLCVWKYSIPFAVNLSTSVLFFTVLGESPINIAVPVTNATTFAVTAVAGAALGEHIDVLRGMVGIALICLGNCLVHRSKYHSIRS